MKRHAPATLRNREPLLSVLREVLPANGTVVEIASGTGEHVVFFAQHLSGIDWQPSDVDQDALASIEAHRLEAGLDNLRKPVRIDVLSTDWGEAAAGAGALVCINMIHIAPWACAEALLRGAAKLLPDGAPLVMYGPFRIDGKHTAPSNETFDASLRHENSAWGIRDLTALTGAAETAGLHRDRVIAMPANNHAIVLRRQVTLEAKASNLQTVPLD